MSKKATVKDVARESGVSIATVSYIMNNRTDMKISEATRKKVLQIANLLDYTPSHAAKSLATGRNNIIGVSYHLNEKTPSRNLEITGFVNLLIERLNRLKYDVLFMPIKADDDNIPVNRNIDGIIAIDLTHTEFLKMSNDYMVPLICIDTIVNDTLFYQIYSDIAEHINEAREILGDDFYVVSDHYMNEEFARTILDGIDDEHIIYFPDGNFEKLKTLSNKKVIVLSSYLALMVMPYLNLKNTVVISSNEIDHTIPETVKIIRNDVSKKANLAINILMNALDKKFDVDHVYKI